MAGDSNGVTDVFVRDRLAATTERVSIGAGGQANSASASPAISGNGRYVAFTSHATNLVSGDTNGLSDVFLHDRRTGKTSRVSLSNAGRQLGGASSGWHSYFSYDGRYVAFTSFADDVVANDTNDKTDVFVRDRGG